ncbi:hypothetical protein LUZ60_002988 [Juncus effusus]|nr:hypothetical protein LUZ60_002988 [Juncus effusus]
MVFRASSSSIIVSSFLFLCLIPLSISRASHELHGNRVSGKDGKIAWRRQIAEESNPNSTITNTTTPIDQTPFVLAAERTHRKDPLNRYNFYTGGWNISSQHYWASVAFTAVPLFAVSIAWFVGFGLALFVIACYFCCCRRRNYSYSRVAYAISLILLILFTLAAIAGCVVLYNAQEKFHKSTLGTLDYMVNQADVIVGNLQNFSTSLASAKSVGVDQIFLPANVQGNIDNIQTKLNTSADGLATRAAKNSNNIKSFLDSMRLYLIIIAAVMLFLAFFGFLLSIFGLQFLVSVLVVIGWILVAGTFILCGIFLLLHNVLTDTCVAMDDWVTHPHEQTALDDILPCVDVSTANESMYRSREVTYQLVGIVNQVITNISNQNFPPIVGPPLYYNQSGPLIPPLCSPYNPDMSNRTCLVNEVTLEDSSKVWKEYECEAAASGSTEICTGVGRLTPSLYSQMLAAVSVSQGLYQYGPFLTQLEDCSFVRETFTSISANNCPELDRDTKWTYVGLVIVSVAVMLSLIFWVVYARERRHRIYNKDFLARSIQPPLPLQDKADPFVEE